MKVNTASILNVNVITAIRNIKGPHTIKVALCITCISGNVMDVTCTCAAGKVGYCNHTLGLVLKISKYSLFGSKTTKHLNI